MMVNFYQYCNVNSFLLAQLLVALERKTNGMSGRNTINILFVYRSFLFGVYL